MAPTRSSNEALLEADETPGDILARETVGEWGPVIPLPNVPAHAHLLPDGNVLFWGRRENATGSMDQHVCTPQIWDWNAAPPACRPTPQPKALDGSTVNLFCSGHAFQPDGRLFVAGGHLQDGHGLNQACIYDWRADTWEPLLPMTHGRWYPTATSLPDGTILVTSGSYGDGDQTPNNRVPQVWDGQGWTDLADKVVSLYPRMIVLGGGQVFVAGTDPDGFILDALESGTWSASPSRAGGDRQYAPSLLYAPNKVVFVGGGNDPRTKRPTAKTEVIAFDDPDPAWKPAAPMNIPRRQHNATLLPDGTVLVTGGTQGPEFNNLTPGEPVHRAELWDPKTDTWTLLAAEDKDRCYHSTALLLPDATVLSAGGGEYFTHDQTIDPKDVHKNGQVFRPPYLFRGERPELKPGPDGADYGAQFTLTHDRGPAVARLTALRLGSVTHSLDSNQRLVELKFDTNGADIIVTAPTDANACPPGYYMVFALCDRGVPSQAHIMRFGPHAGPHDRRAAMPQAAAARDARAAAHAAVPKGTHVVVGLTSQCPYGLARCWSGAYQSLKKLSGVGFVKDQADATTSTADLWLAGTGLPDLNRWIKQFTATANGSYDIRGFEVTVSGTVQIQGAGLDLRLGRRVIRLEPLGNSEKVQWDWDRKAPAAVMPDEAAALARLQESVKLSKSATVTGPFRIEGGTPVIAVRVAEVPAREPAASKRRKRSRN